MKRIPHRLKRWRVRPNLSLGLWVWGLSWLGWAGDPPASPADGPALRAWLTTHLEQPRFAAAQWGVHIVSLDTGKTLFSHNAAKLFQPASTTKLFTGALGLDRLGPDFRARTSLYAATRPDATGTVAGDLILYGRGDPTIAARFNGGDLSRALAPLVDALVAAGVKRIEGDLIADESYFRGPPLGAGWEWDDLQYYYGAEASALTVNDNVADVMVKGAFVQGQPARVFFQPTPTLLTVSNRAQTLPTGAKRDLSFSRLVDGNLVYVSGQIAEDDPGYTESIAVHGPARWFGELLQEALRQRGLTITGRVRVTDWLARAVEPCDPARMIELAHVESPPLRDLLGRMMKPSQNLYAQLLLLQVGAAELARRPRPATGVLPPSAASSAEPAVNPDATAEDAGVKALESLLVAAGIPPGEVLLEEGTGLSRRNLVTPRAIVQLLEHMSRHPHAEVFRESLPVAGVDGTLRNRMKETSAAGNARAKTGSLRYVNCLAGYVSTGVTERLAFALMLNNYRHREPDPPPRADLDAVVLTLAGLRWRGADQSE